MEFTQDMGPFKGKLSLSLDNQDVLTCLMERPLSKEVIKLPLDDIAPQYQVFKITSFKALIAASAALLLCVTFGWIASSLPAPDDAGYFVLSFFAGIASLIAVFRLMRSRVNAVCFYDLNGKQVLALAGNKPTEQAVISFCEELKSRIDKIKYRGEISPDRMAVILHKHVMFLWEQGILDDQAVTQATANIDNRLKPKVVNIHEARC